MQGGRRLVSCTTSPQFFFIPIVMRVQTLADLIKGTTLLIIQFVG